MLVGNVKSSLVARSPPFLVPKGGFVNTTSYPFISFPALDKVSASFISPSISCSIAFINASLCVSCTSSQPVNASSLSNFAVSASNWNKSSVFSLTYWLAEIMNPNVPQAGSLQRSPGCGFINLVITSIRTLGVKY